MGRGMGSCKQREGRQGVEGSTEDTKSTKNIFLSIHAWFFKMQVLPGELTSILFSLLYHKNEMVIYKMLYVAVFSLRMV